MFKKLKIPFFVGGLMNSPVSPFFFLFLKKTCNVERIRVRVLASFSIAMVRIFLFLEVIAGKRKN